jgi:hypothetical protein
LINIPLFGWYLALDALGLRRPAQDMRTDH